MLLFCR